MSSIVKIIRIEKNSWNFEVGSEPVSVAPVNTRVGLLRSTLGYFLLISGLRPRNAVYAEIGGKAKKRVTNKHDTPSSCRACTAATGATLDRLQSCGNRPAACNKVIRKLFPFWQKRRFPLRLVRRTPHRQWVSFPRRASCARGDVLIS